ncbi:MAG TPA: PilZ domain-containing protein [Polyangiales bacterium]
MTQPPTARGLARVLFVPHDLLSGELRESFLDRESFLVRTAVDADTALAMAEVWRPSLVVFRSELDGIRVSDFCLRMRAARSAAAPKLVMLTEQVTGSMDDVVEAGSDCHLISPVDNTQLLDTIAALLEVAQRRSPRAALDTLVHARGFAETDSSSGATLANCLNVSEDGMLLECNHQLQLNSEGCLQFFLPGAAQRLQLRAVVRLAVDEIRQHYAIEWRDIAATDRKLIRRYVEGAGA